VFYRPRTAISVAKNAEARIDGPRIFPRTAFALSVRARRSVRTDRADRKKTDERKVRNDGIESSFFRRERRIESVFGSAPKGAGIIETIGGEFSACAIAWENATRLKQRPSCSHMIRATNRTGGKIWRTRLQFLGLIVAAAIGRFGQVEWTLLPWPLLRRPRRSARRNWDRFLNNGSRRHQPLSYLQPHTTAMLCVSACANSEHHCSDFSGPAGQLSLCEMRYLEEK